MRSVDQTCGNVDEMTHWGVKGTGVFTRVDNGAIRHALLNKPSYYL